MILLVVFGVGIVAGFVDAIAGGGGLIMLPGLLLTGLPVGSAIATNKLCGTCGAITSSLKFAHAKQINWRACALMGLPVVFGAYLGSRSIDRLPSTWAEPVVIILIIAITLFVVFKPNFGSKATGSAKVLNLLTNVTALITFAIAGNIHYSKGISGALGVSIGSFLGATVATKKGAAIIKPLFIAVAIILSVKLLFDYAT